MSDRILKDLDGTDNLQKVNQRIKAKVKGTGLDYIVASDLSRNIHILISDDNENRAELLAGIDRDMCIMIVGAGETTYFSREWLEAHNNGTNSDEDRRVSGIDPELSELYPVASLRWLTALANVNPVKTFCIARYLKSEIIRVNEGVKPYSRFTGKLTGKMVRIYVGELRITMSEEDYSVSKVEDINEALS